MTTPNPGSPKAIKLGCTCPVISNKGGKGFLIGDSGKPHFWINESCKVHGKEKK